MIQRTLYLLLLLLLQYPICAQKGNESLAFKHFSNNDFESALDEYLLLLSNDSLNEQFNYRTGVCFLNTNINKSLAIPYLKKVIEIGGKYEANAHFLLGKAYHFAMKFDLAIAHFNTYKQKKGGNAASPLEVEKAIEYCYNAKEIIKFPLLVSFENLGPHVNSMASDYFPFLPADESFILFNSVRTEEDAKNSDIYFSSIEKGAFTPAQKMDKILPEKDFSEEIVGLSNTGKTALLYLTDQNKKGDLYLAEKSSTTSSFYHVKKLPEHINSKNGHEIAASLLSEGEVLYFASDREGGMGGTDLYACKKLPDGTWGPAFNLGPKINTTWDEDFPNISPDGNTLYFSSKGHTSMGGYDIFSTRLDVEKNEFEKPQNIGHPINTVYDDMNFRLSSNGRYGYLSSLRPEGLGNYDIYRVTFEDLEPEYTIIKGFIKTANNEPLEEIIMDITDRKTGDLYGSYLPNFNNMRYVMILPPGQYELFIEVPGFKRITENIDVFDKSSFVPELIKHIYLEPER